jgi:hypothetical protein
MPCEICGSACQDNRCADCEREAEAEVRAGDDGDGPVERETDLLHECTECGSCYRAVQRCPDCGSQRRRYVGGEWTVEQTSLDGGAHEGQATLEGGVARLPEGDR